MTLALDSLLLFVLFVLWSFVLSLGGSVRRAREEEGRSGVCSASTWGQLASKNEIWLQIAQTGK